MSPRTHKDQPHPQTIPWMTPLGPFRQAMLDEGNSGFHRLGDLLRQKNRQVWLKIGLYLIEIILLGWIATLVPNPWFGIIFGILGGFFLTKGTDRLFKRIGIEEGAGKAETEHQKALIDSIVEQFTFFPPILQDSVSDLAYSGAELKEERRLKPLRQHHAVYGKFLAARQAIREKKHKEARRLLEDILGHPKDPILTDIQQETRRMLAKLPPV